PAPFAAREDPRLQGGERGVGPFGDREPFERRGIELPRADEDRGAFEARLGGRDGDDLAVGEREGPGGSRPRERDDPRGAVAPEPDEGGQKVHLADVAGGLEFALHALLA